MTPRLPDAGLSPQAVLRLLVVLALAMLVPLMVAAPADAAGAMGVSNDCDGSDCVQGMAFATNVGDDAAGGVVDFACVISAPGAASVAVTSCSFRDLDAPRFGLPGSALATVGTGTIRDASSGEICWAGHATFALGGALVPTSGCSQINVGVGTGSLAGDASDGLNLLRYCVLPPTDRSCVLFAETLGYLNQILAVDIHTDG